ncbi:MAG: hypothetical protein JST24_02405, partial [Acidobacteria bacterium]|nr:hypothetical protein [Acidobacteriota bacterium]
KTLMASGDAVKLVAGLLGLARDGRSHGYELPNDPPKPTGPKRDSYASKPPFSKPAYAKTQDRDEKPREFKKPWKPKGEESRFDKGPKRFEDRAHGPRKGENTFKPKDKRTGTPFTKKREG